MPFCPKCETEYRDGFGTCLDCDVDLVDNITRPASLDDLEEQYAADMFAEEVDSIRFCAHCFLEFAPEATVCRPCGDAPLMTMARAEFEHTLATSPLDPWLKRSDDDVPPAGLKLVWTALSPAEAGFACASLEGMGVDAIVGGDALDRFDDHSRIGLWVADADVEACAMILPEDPEEWRDDDDDEGDVDSYDALVVKARAYAELSKRTHAIELCSRAIELTENRPEAFFTLGSIVGAQGLVVQAQESFRAALDRSARGAAGAEGWMFALYGFMTEGGGVSFTGPVADEAIRVLKEHSGAHPRDIDPMRLLLQACHARGEKANCAEVRARITAVNRSVLEMDGIFTELG